MNSGFEKVYCALAADPETVLRFARDIAPPTEPVEDYITDLDQRCALFAHIHKLHRKYGVEMPNAAALGFYMVAPISGIQKHLKAIRGVWTDKWLLPSMVNLRAPLAMNSYILSHHTSPPAQPVPSLSLNTSTTPDNHDIRARKRALGRIVKERDGNICLLSGMSDPKATHIFPLTRDSKQFDALNTLLEFFWGSDKTLAWRKLYEDPTITQSPANYLSLNRQLDFWFKTARFAFKPLSQTPTTITLQFHWLRQAKLLPKTPVDARGEMLLDLAGLGNPGGPMLWGSCLAHRASGVPLRTGQTYVIRAKHPEELPSFDLLELRWNLARIAAICGAADDETLYDCEEELCVETRVGSNEHSIRRRLQKLLRVVVDELLCGSKPDK